MTTANITFPQVEALARSVSLAQVTMAEPVARELYGTISVVVDVDALHRFITTTHPMRQDSPAFGAALAIIEARIARLQ
jgi:hypothetical protein